MDAALAATGCLDYPALARELGVDLDEGFVALAALYDDVDARNARNTANLPLPCHRGCAMCCHESVFVTPLEFLFAWRYFEAHTSSQERHEVIGHGLRLYSEHKLTIEALHRWPQDDPEGRLRAAKTLRFACPLLDGRGSCRIYPARELLARLFGQSFNAEGGVYGCHLVTEALASREVTLMRAEAQSARLRALPLTGYRQIYPFFLNLFFGPAKAAGSL